MAHLLRELRFAESPAPRASAQVLVRVILAIALGVAGTTAQAQESAPATSSRLTVDVQVPSGTYYVGQAIELRVGVEAGGDRPQVETPRVDGADVNLFRTEMVQKGSNAIGSVVNERVYYIWRFHVLPHRAGSLTIPGVVARLGERTGRGRSVRTAIHELPAEGRTSAFLGGVGRLEVDAAADLASVRVGQSLEYRIILDGPAARGSKERPDMNALKRLPVGLEVDPLPTEATADPPSRIFRYRLRPTKPGDVALPPVAIAHFDPKSAHYFTQMSPSVPIRVVDVPAFDPGSLAYGRGEWQSRANANRQRALMQSALAIVLAGAIGSLLAARRARKRLRSNPNRVAERLVKKLAPGQAHFQAEPLARRVTDGLIDYLFAAAARPRGALTPLEARVTLHKALDRPACAERAGDLAERAGQIIAACDRARYAGSNSLVDAQSLQADAHELFKDLAALPAIDHANGQLDLGAKSKGGDQQ